MTSLKLSLDWIASYAPRASLSWRGRAMALTLADRQKAEVKAATDLAELVHEYGVAYHYPINFPCM